MGNNYNGNYEKYEVPKKGSFNWNALIYWLISLLISLLPMYIELIKFVNEHGQLKVQFLTNYIVNGDILWVFSTLLLFVLADSHLKTRKKEKKWVKNLFLIGCLVFVFIEATWLAFYFMDIVETVKWPLWIGSIMIALSLIIATPLKIEFIKED